jgi:hypothetical protein
MNFSDLKRSVKEMPLTDVELDDIECRARIQKKNLNGIVETYFGEWIPELVAEVKRLKKENHELRQTLEGNGMMILKEEKPDLYNDRLDIIEVDY